MTVLERLSEVLKIAFQKENIYKKADMAKFLGYANSYFSEITNGKENLSDIFLKNISDKLNVNQDWILTGKGDMFNWPDNLDKPLIKKQVHYGGSGYNVESSNMISIPKDVFEQITKLTDTVLSQQRTIEEQHKTISHLTVEGKKTSVHRDENVICADAAGSDFKR